jgi:hypothetical protein
MLNENKERKMNEAESRMFGMSAADIREQYMESITARLSGMEMVVAGILSDAQELLSMDRAEAARKQLNIAKFILFEMMEEDDVRAQYRKKVASLKDIPKNYGKETV